MSFDYKNKTLHAENLSLKEIAEHVGTPFYCYSKSKLIENFSRFKKAFSGYPTTICFAIKSNSNQSILKILSANGSGADCVSKGEIMRAEQAGIDPKKMVFAGVGKTVDEMKYGLKIGIGQFNVESREELKLLDDVAKSMGIKAPVAIRVNPDIDAITHEKITTGRKIDKFGIPWYEVIETYKLAKKLNNINVIGVSCHIGSQITDITPYQQALKKIASLVLELKEINVEISKIDFGGGLGVKYKDEKLIEIEDYANTLINIIKPTGADLIIEPGRRIAADIGVLVSEVQYIKNSGERKFAIIDAGMNDLARPAIYTSYHEIISVNEGEKNHKYDVVGPVCESSDIFGRERPMTELSNGDLIAILQAGAYGMVMAGNYNTRPMIPEVLVDDNKYKIIRKRQTIEELISLDC